MQLSSTPVAYRVHEIEYLHVEGRAFEASIYQPEGEGPFPALLDVHGGQWTIPTAHRHANAPMAKYLASRGMVVMAIEFRQDREHRFPDSLADSNCAMRWLRAHAEEYRAARAPIGALGASSGGHLVMLNAMKPADPRFCSMPVEGATCEEGGGDYLICHSPILDPLGRRKFAEQTGREDILKSTDFWFHPPEMVSEANPQLILDRHEPVRLVPALILQGTADKNIDHRLQDRFAEAYRAAGGEIQLEKFEGAPHIFFNEPGPHTDRCLEVIGAFVNRQIS
ncbi:MAG TPA: alpha/beta hydrolase [Chloroflexota bacterium]|nr:alpha/beta hydrolase [Chloroflexota bacterium]